MMDEEIVKTMISEEAAASAAGNRRLENYMKITAIATSLIVLSIVFLLLYFIRSIVLMFVGTQLAWVLRPFFNYYELFLRPVEGNFYTSVLNLLMRSMGQTGTLIIAFLGLILVGWLFLSVLLPTKEMRERARALLGASLCNDHLNFQKAYLS